MKRRNIILGTAGLLILLAIAGGSIWFFRKEPVKVQSEKPIARANKIFLYPADLKGLIPAGTSREDSLNLVSRFVDSWVRKQLMLAKADSEVVVNEAELEQKMLDYRYSLLVYELQKKYIREKLDTSVRKVEIENYYKNNPANFELRQNIVQVLQVRMMKSSPKLPEIKALLRNFPPGSLEKLKPLCQKYTLDFSLADSVWVDFERVIRGTPFQGIPNRVQFLQQNRFSETTESNQIYLLRILDYKVSSQLSPLGFVEDQVKEIIINQRRVALMQELEKQTYENARKEKQFEKYE
jgi:hypothetical protein